MRFSIPLAFLLALPAANLPAQSFTRSFVTPRGAEFFEGNSSSSVMFGYTATRTQQVDAYLVGKEMPVIRALAWRRNAGSSSALKTSTLTLLMAHADITQVGSTYANNYKSTPIPVLPKTTVKLADWTRSMTGPTPFDMVIPFRIPFVYNRKDALLWEVAATSTASSSYTQDWCSSLDGMTYGDYPVELAAGCATAQGSFTQEVLFRAGTNLEFGIRLSGGPANAAALGLLGTRDPNLVLPGLCAPLRVEPLVLLALGSTDAAGALPLPATPPVGTPWSPVFVGADLYVQCLAADPSRPGLPLALTNGQKCPAPTGNGQPPIRCQRIYNMKSATAATGSSPSASAVPTRFLF